MLNAKGKKRIKNIVYTAMFAALIAVCSLISVPFAVPFTLQTFSVFLALFVLGGRRGTWAVLAYVCLGLAGLPVFSGFVGGFAVLFGATGGYIIGFVLAAFAFWAGEKLFGKKTLVLLLLAAAGLVICYIFGSIWYAFIYAGGTGGGFATAMAVCVLPFIVPDILKIGLALLLGNRLKKYVK
ncbi:MAG: biotin transporter BioY [Clostridia bacterium]|nr:biotin transporter BioY [Clostridia bacterium]